MGPDEDEKIGLYVWLDGDMVEVDETFDLRAVQLDDTWTRGEVEALRDVFDKLWDGEDDE